MIVFQDTDTHSLISWNLTKLRNFNIVQIVHLHRFLMCLVISSIHYFQRHTGIPKLLNGLFTKASAFRTPEFNTNGQFLQVITPGTLRQCRKQELHKFFPGIPLRQANGLPSHSMCSAINSSKVHPVHTAHHLTPGSRVNYFIKPKTFLSFT